ncbi:hypothetical protein Bca4012_019951 [Brassica carinata]
MKTDDDGKSPDGEWIFDKAHTTSRSSEVWQLVGLNGATHMVGRLQNLEGISVKSGFRTKTLYPDKSPRIIPFGPNIKSLLAFSWKLKCSPQSTAFCLASIIRNFTSIQEGT